MRDRRTPDEERELDGLYSSRPELYGLMRLIEMLDAGEWPSEFLIDEAHTVLRQAERAALLQRAALGLERRSERRSERVELVADDRVPPGEVRLLSPEQLEEWKKSRRET